MGKIRVSALGTEDEKAKKDKARVRREEKKKRLTHLSGMKGGEKLVDMSAVGSTEEVKTPREWQAGAPAEAMTLPTVKEKRKAPRSHGHAYLNVKKLIDHNKFYPAGEAMELVKKTSFSKFDGSVEVHLNTTEKGIRGQVSLPHGTGRQVRVAIASDELLEKISSGKIDFDILVSSPMMMPKLARFAKILGPKGLMPNPKSGTISAEPEKIAVKLSSGMTQFKTETEAPIIHFVIGKVSFKDKDLEENFTALINAIGVAKIKNVFIKATMGPSVRVKIP